MFLENRQNENLFNGDAIVVDCSHVSKTVGVTLFMVRALCCSLPHEKIWFSVNTRSREREREN